MALSDIFKSLDRWVGYQPESRMLTPAQFWGSGMDTRFPFPGRTAAGEPVDIETALALPVVLRAFSLMSGDIGPLPIDAYRRADKRRVEMDPPTWLEVPDPGNPNFGRPQFISQCVVSLMGAGNLYVRAYPDRYNTAFVRVLDPWRTFVETGRDGIDRYRIGTALLEASQVIHVPMLALPGQSMGKSPISLLAEPIASGLAAIKFGGYFFANGSAMQGVIEAPAGAQVDAKQIKEQMERGNRGLSKSHALGVLTGGATFKQLTVNPRDSQMVELQQFIVEDVGRAFGIPPYLLGSQEPGAVAYASTSNARIDYVQHGVQPIVTRLEHALSTLVPGADTFLRFNLSALLRGDQAARYTAYNTLAQIGAITIDEIRAWEDWGPADEAVGADTENGGFMKSPNNTAPGGNAPDATPEDHPAPETPQRTDPVVIHNHLPPTAFPDMPDVNVTVHTRAEDAEQVERRLAQEQEQRTQEYEVNRSFVEALLEQSRVLAQIATEMRDRPDPVVNVAAPDIRVEAPAVTVAAPAVTVNVPQRQTVDIASLPPMNARVKRDRAGRIEAITED